MLTTNHVNQLCQSFPDSILSVKVQSTSKDKTKAMLVLYLQHTDVANRLDSVDPCWSLVFGQPSIQERIDWNGNVSKYISIEATLVIHGVTRTDFGEGDDPKSAASDAFKRAAMRFGVGRNLYDSELVWVPYNEQTDRYKQFTLEEYRKHERRKPEVKLPGPAVGAGPNSVPATSGFTQSGNQQQPALLIPKPKAAVPPTNQPSPEPAKSAVSGTLISPADIEKIALAKGYTMEAGRFKGKQLALIDHVELNKYLIDLEADNHKKGVLPEKLTGMARINYWSVVAELERRSKEFLLIPVGAGSDDSDL